MSAITGSINVNKISKDRLYQGERGKWLNIVLVPTPDSDYGDYMIVESIPYEERQAGKKGTILGNAKIIVPRAGGVEITQEDPENPDLPF